MFFFDEPFREEAHQHLIEFPNPKVPEFNFAAIQLNRLNWRDFLNQFNPVAAALMSKMRIAAEARPKVKAGCLRLLATLQLDLARTKLISAFVDTYLRLTKAEEQVFQAEIDKIEFTAKEEVMEIVTSWMERGIEQGGQQKARSLILRQLEQKIGTLAQEHHDRISALSSEQLDDLAIALLNFSSTDV